MQVRAPLKPAAQVVFDFDSLLGTYRNRTLLNVPEVAAILRRKKDFVYGLIQEGRLHAHGVGVGRERESRTITTRSVAQYIAETAQYEGADYQARVRDMIATWTPAQRRWAAEECARQGLSPLTTPTPTPKTK